MLLPVRCAFIYLSARAGYLLGVVDEECRIELDGCCKNHRSDNDTDDSEDMKPSEESYEDKRRVNRGPFPDDRWSYEVVDIPDHEHAIGRENRRVDEQAGIACEESFSDLNEQERDPHARWSDDGEECDEEGEDAPQEGCGEADEVVCGNEEDRLYEGYDDRAAYNRADREANTLEIGLEDLIVPLAE